jgi:hypothetical protein
VNQTIEWTTTLETLNCYSCGVPFAMPSNLMRRFRATKDTFYCPNGHGQIFAKSTQQKLEEVEARLHRERQSADARIRAARDQADAAERSARSLRGANTKLRKRVAAGVCPCCRRSFQNVARHMAGQHPDFAEATS